MDTSFSRFFIDLTSFLFCIYVIIGLFFAMFHDKKVDSSVKRSHYYSKVCNNDVEASL
ncbi:hypothetical protein BDB00DRAFT_795319 [Zychaea mexicana]|uniref:uncharacterized protein n=1 Tax=Zychaea mexicana TaxID=64656 RepID=UPI0022FF3DD2|nr:uncharacterized protein BDB00DRAFT_795319 [Zychaea mexicana]KAI9499726.1 hypothetical protein BDB00DRAFT_795319 [Zychaea mexicana]